MKRYTEQQAWLALAKKVESSGHYFLCWELDPGFRWASTEMFTGTLAAKMLARMTAHRGKRQAPWFGCGPWWKTQRARVAFCRRMAALAAAEKSKK